MDTTKTAMILMEKIRMVSQEEFKVTIDMLPDFLIVNIYDKDSLTNQDRHNDMESVLGFLEAFLQSLKQKSLTVNDIIKASSGQTNKIVVHALGGESVFPYKAHLNEDEDIVILEVELPPHIMPTTQDWTLYVGNLTRDVQNWNNRFWKVARMVQEWKELSADDLLKAVDQIDRPTKE